MPHRTKSTRERPGIAAVEFAVIMPVMALLIIGLWEVGRMVEVQQYLVNSVREGARQASTGVKTTDQVKQVVVTYLTQKGLTSVTAANVTVTSVSNTSITDPTGDPTRSIPRIGFDSVQQCPLDRARQDHDIVEPDGLGRLVLDARHPDRGLAKHSSQLKGRLRHDTIPANI